MRRLPLRSFLLVGAVVCVATALGWYADVPLPSAATPAARTGSGSAGKPASPWTESRPNDSSGRQPSDAKGSISSAASPPTSVEERLRETVRYLASDELEGRGLGTRGLELAAEHIAQAFKKAGLKTDLYTGTPFQRFSISRRLVLGDSNRAELVSSKGNPLALEMHQDYVPLSSSRAGEFDLPLVFAGYGITAPELGYDDYSDVDVTGKAVIVLRREPQQNLAGGVFNGPVLTEHAYLVRKVSNAVGHGAAAVVFLTDSHTLGDSAAGSSEKDPGQVSDPLLGFSAGGHRADRKVPVLHIRRAVLEPVVRSAAGKSLASLEREIDADLTARSIALDGWRLRGEVSMKMVGREIKNVVGVLEGYGGLADEAIVLGAHYDHLGMGGMSSLSPGSRTVHNGADDNASGTAVLIELARKLGTSDSAVRRAIILVAFSAEEAGLIGSEYYVRHPVVGLKKTVAMVNFDMVGRLRRDTLNVGGIESAVEFRPWIKELAAEYGFRLVSSPAIFGPSDHLSFYMEGVPVLHFFTGLHQDYHRPSDDYDKLDYEGMRRITELSAKLVTRLATDAKRPQFTGAFESLAELVGPIRSETARTGPRGPWLGVVADPRHKGPGYAVRQVIKAGPAEKAGLQAGDVIREFDETGIRQAADLPRCLRNMQPGGRVPVVVERHGTRFELEVTLGAR